MAFQSLFQHLQEFFCDFSLGLGGETSSSCRDWPEVSGRAATAPQLLSVMVPTSNDALDEGSLLEFQRASEV